MNSSDYAGAATCCTVTEYGIMYGQKQMPSQERGGDQQNRMANGTPSRRRRTPITRPTIAMTPLDPAR